jgi:hypothetical protein
MIRCPKCGATLADGRTSCTVCGHRLGGQTAEIESDVVAALAALTAESPAVPARPAAPTLVRKGPGTLAGARATSGLDELPHPVLADGIDVSPTIVTRGRNERTGAPADEIGNSGTQIGHRAYGERPPASVAESGDHTELGVVLGRDESRMGDAVPDWLAGLEAEIGAEMDSGFGPPALRPPSGGGSGFTSGTALGVRAEGKAGPSFDLDPMESTDPGVPASAGERTSLHAGGAFEGFEDVDPLLAQGAGVVRRRRHRPSGAVPRTARVDRRLEPDAPAETPADRVGSGFDDTQVMRERPPLTPPAAERAPSRPAARPAAPSSSASRRSRPVVVDPTEAEWDLVYADTIAAARVPTGDAGIDPLGATIAAPQIAGAEPSSGPVPRASGVVSAPAPVAPAPPAALRPVVLVVAALVAMLCFGVAVVLLWVLGQL